MQTWPTAQRCTVIWTVLLVLMGVLMCLPVSSARAAVLLDEQFNTDVFLDSSWSRSHSSVAIDIPNGWLRIGSNGAAGDFADKHCPFPLPLVIEWRERTFSGSGSTFSLPILQLWWGPTGDGSYHVTYVQEILPIPSGWLLGIWTNVHTLGTTSWDQWRTVKAIIRSDGGELFAKLDGDLDFTPISSATWTVPSEITRIRLSQHSDDVSDFDYVKVSDFTSTETLRIGQSKDCLTSIDATYAIPIYLDNHDTVKAFDIPLDYNWGIDPVGISFVGTRLEGKNGTFINQLNANGDSIRIGYIASTGDPVDALAPFDAFTQGVPIARIIMPGCLRQYFPAPDTATIPLEVNPVSVELTDKFGARYVPEILFDSSWVRSYVLGDANDDSICTISDAVYLINYIFSGGPAPLCLLAADADCGSTITISDAVWLINYIFGGGPHPGSNCLCGPLPPFAKSVIGHASIATASLAEETTNEIAVDLEVSADARAIQLDFNITGDVRNIEIKSNVSNLQLFSSEVESGYRMGLIDLTGTAVIPSGKTQIATIAYEGDGELSVSSAIVVDNDASEMNVEISNSKLENVLPTEYSLCQNRPNPFNPTTDISFSLPKTGQVKLVVYNILGAEVATLVEEVRSAGVHRVSWNGTNSSGQQVASGIYLYRLTAGEFAATKKMLLLK